MKILILFLIICLIHSTKVKVKVKAKNKSKKFFYNVEKAGLQSSKRVQEEEKRKLREFINFRKKNQKEVSVKKEEVKRTQAYMDEQDALSVKGDTIYKKNKSGRYDLTDPNDMLISSGQLTVRFIQKKVDGDNMSQFQRMQYKLNENYLYFLKNDDDLYGVQYGIDLLDIPTNRDNMLEAQCCIRIEPQIKHVKIELYDYEGYCFRIELKDENWLICDEDQPGLLKFKETLTRQIINIWWKVNNPGHEVPQFVAQRYCELIPFDWTYSNQLKWPCNCVKPDYKQQSPVHLNVLQTTEIYDRFLMLDFPKTRSIRYGIVVQEPEFYANFGNFAWITPQDNYYFQTSKFVFKISKSEHEIEQVAEVSKQIGEFQLHGETGDGQVAILSIPLILGNENGFVKQLNLKKWEYPYLGQDGLNLICLKGEKDPQPTDFDLGLMFQSSKKLNKNRSYFRYMGSLTKPPCNQDVMWFVMRYPAEISDSQLQDLKKYGLNKAKINPNNVRVQQALNDRIVELYNACERKPPKSKPEPPGEYNYIHASQVLKTYGMASSEAPVSDVFSIYGDKNNKDLISLSKNLILQKLDNSNGQAPENIPPETMRALIDLYTQQKIGTSANDFLQSVGADYK